MNTKDIHKLSEIEQLIIDAGIPRKLSQLKNFPYKDMDALRAAKKR